MTDLETIKKAMEGVTPGPWQSKIDAQFYFSIFAGDFKIATARDILADRGYANTRYIAAVNPAAISELLSTLESLQRENERLGADVKREAELATHMANDCNDAQARAEAAEAEVKRLEAELAMSKPLYTRRQLEDRVKTLEKALKPFADVAKYYDPPEEDENQKLWGIATMPTIGNVRDARTALASTGGEHHA